MKRIALVIGLLLLPICFYGAWPAWSGYAIRNALQNQDAATLGAKIDFEQVQASMRPAVTQKVSEGFDRYQSQLGPAGSAIMGQLKKDAVPRIVDASLRTLMTPEMIIRIASEAGPLKATIERIMREQLGRGLPQGGIPTGETGQPIPLPQGLGGLLGKVVKPSGGPTPVPAEPTASTPPAPPRKFSMANVRSFSFSGPLSFQVGLVKEPGTPEPDVTAQMSFTGGDWKITGLVPRL
jgi:Protein of unknown function (DUF2939)